MSKSESIILRKSFAFGVIIVNMYKDLMAKNQNHTLSKQLLRCGTSIGANVREAHSAESKNDFIHKMGMAQKETSETIYWLELLNASGYIQPGESDSVSKDANEILLIIRSIILTSKNGPRKKIV
ncbi:four helix bundle protein [Flavitalea sp.]|nr:four helix bundle protein [Flavitalea sp.]